MTAVDLLVALVIAVGLVGIVLPILPGTLLILGALLGWALHADQGAGWAVFAIAAALLAIGTVVKYLIPGRSMKRSGVPSSTLLLGGVLGVVGFFVIPIIGLPLGFVLGVWLAEVRRVGEQAARTTTVNALKAVGVSIVIEFAFALAATLVWIVGVILV
ncbi:DUF456 domain-containing protein [Nocardioides sp. AE5]|uniref:DUF456 domain-containing protein n=1 Tax=Nocardioides sp. AE5 TaxID=2962573 RepID=UPI0028817E76|nr:DUF456 domain-containing protein [Nocardioides sp. AE5]MDT0201359.1 DUF456 domain-containing protein [Nocardioides sp. AE5]